jgi:xanthine dehydrogenase large subunit
LSHSPTTYKVPNVTDVPEDFRVAFYQEGENSLNVYGSKAVGEPPLLLGVSVWAAIKQALSSEAEGRAPLRLPATNEEILLRLTTNADSPVRRSKRSVRV